MVTSPARHSLRAQAPNTPFARADEEAPQTPAIVPSTPAYAAVAATPSGTDAWVSASAAEEPEASPSPAAVTALLDCAADLLALCVACAPPLLREEAPAIFSEFVAKSDVCSAIGFVHLIVRDLRARFPDPNVDQVLHTHAATVASLDQLYAACGISAQEEELSARFLTHRSRLRRLTHPI